MLGAILQVKLGIAHILALDIRQQSTGFIYELQVSHALLKADPPVAVERRSVG